MGTNGRLGLCRWAKCWRPTRHFVINSEVPAKFRLTNSRDVHRPRRPASVPPYYTRPGTRPSDEWIAQMQLIDPAHDSRPDGNSLSVEQLVDRIDYGLAVGPIADGIYHLLDAEQVQSFKHLFRLLNGPIDEGKGPSSQRQRSSRSTLGGFLTPRWKTVLLKSRKAWVPVVPTVAVVAKIYAASSTTVSPGVGGQFNPFAHSVLALDMSPMARLAHFVHV
jgi:hypothetical protein